MTGSRNRVAVMHGVNLDTLGRRDPEIYGTLTLSELEYRVHEWARELDLEASFFQTNHEGEFCEFLHRAPGDGRRRADQRRRLDPLLVGDPRRARGRRASPRSRSTSATSPIARTGARSPSSTGSSPASSPARGSTATARRSRSSRASSTCEPGARSASGAADRAGRRAGPRCDRRRRPRQPRRLRARGDGRRRAG